MVMRKILKRKILNLTQHSPTGEQLEAGVFNLPPYLYGEIKCLLTFDTLPTREEMEERAEVLSDIAFEEGVSKALIGGAPYFMSFLEKALIKRGITPLYAFSKRESIDVTLPDGSVRKTAVFKHCGFIKGGDKK